MPPVSSWLQSLGCLRCKKRLQRRPTGAADAALASSLLMKGCYKLMMEAQQYNRSLCGKIDIGNAYAYGTLQTLRQTLRQPSRRSPMSQSWGAAGAPIRGKG